MSGLTAAVRVLVMLLVGLVLAGCNSAALPTAEPAPEPSPTTASAGLASGGRPGPTAPASAPPPMTPTAKPASPTPIPESPRPTRTREPASPTSVAAPAVTPEPEPTATATVAGSVPAATATPTAAALRVQTRLDIFDKVWSTVNDTYLYADFGGVDWAGAQSRYEPRVRAVGSDEEFYTLVTEMVAELGDDHSRFLAPADARSEDALERGSADYVGVGIISSPGERSIMVVYVFPGSPAERAGIKRRDRITHVDGVPFDNPRTDPSRIRGVEGTTVRLTVISPGANPREIEVVRERILGGVAPSGRRLESAPSVGYLIIPDLWTGDMDVQVDRELVRLLDEQPPMTGLILDMRGNGGGYRSVLEQILGNFISGEVGEFYDKNSTYPFTITGKALQQRLGGIPLAVLTDGGTESYAEVLAGALQVRGRAVVIGRPTAGNTETIYRYDFEDGSRLWIAQQGFRLQDGTELEGRGVLPDVPMSEDWTAYPESEDPDIRRALEALAKR